MAKILLLEDEAHLRRMMADVLENDGHEVSDYPDGKVVRDKERIEGFDMLITDIIMPEVDGLEAVNALLEANPAIKIIAISGGGSTVTIDCLPYAKGFGASSVMRKPFLVGELLHEVRKLLSPSPKRDFKPA